MNELPTTSPATDHHAADAAAAASTAETNRRAQLLSTEHWSLLATRSMSWNGAAYTRLSPGIEDDFVTGHSLDPEGIARTFGAVDVTSSVSPWHMLVTTPAVVAVISSAIAGVMGGLVAGQLSMALEAAVVVGIGVFLMAVAGLIVYGRRAANSYIARVMASRGIGTHPGRRSGG